MSNAKKITVGKKFIWFKGEPHPHIKKGFSRDYGEFVFQQFFTAVLYYASTLQEIATTPGSMTWCNVSDVKLDSRFIPKVNTIEGC